MIFDRKPTFFELEVTLPVPLVVLGENRIGIFLEHISRYRTDTLLTLVLLGFPVDSLGRPDPILFDGIDQKSLEKQRNCPGIPLIRMHFPMRIQNKGFAFSPRVTIAELRAVYVKYAIELGQK